MPERFVEIKSFVTITVQVKTKLAEFRKKIVNCSPYAPEFIAQQKILIV